MRNHPFQPSATILANPRGLSVDAAQPPSPLAVDAKTLGQMLSLDKGTVEKYRKQGVLPSVNFGRAVRYPVHLVMAKLEKMAGAHDLETGGEPSQA